MIKFILGLFKSKPKAELSDKEILHQLVKEEATNLRVHASFNEIAKLNITSLRSNQINKCIYGQMTGDCFNERSRLLIEQCCSRVYSNNGSLGIDGVLNGKPSGPRYMEYWSPIEVFIDRFENKAINNGRLIDYIKGRTNELVFN